MATARKRGGSFDASGGRYANAAAGEVLVALAGRLSQPAHERGWPGWRPLGGVGQRVAGALAEVRGDAALVGAAAWWLLWLGPSDEGTVEWQVEVGAQG